MTGAGGRVAVRDSAWRWLWFALAVALLDQGTKHLVQGLLEHGASVPVLPILNVVLTYNTGAAFSFLSDAGGWQRWGLSAVAGVVSVVLAVWILRHRRGEQMGLVLALALILGGAVGNLWDRLTLGVVVDFVDVHWRARHWPAFNLADSAISIGAVVVVWKSFSRESGEPAKRKKGLGST